MSSDGVNPVRRKFLVAATSAVGVAGAVGVAVPFVGSWNPSAKAKAAGAPVKADISKLEPGQMVVVEWRGKPVYVVHRTESQVADLASLNDKLKDPDSEISVQPAYIQGIERALRPEIFVVEGLCTHLGCAPKFRPEVGAADLGGDDGTPALQADELQGPVFRKVLGQHGEVELHVAAPAVRILQQHVDPVAIEGVGHQRQVRVRPGAGALAVQRNDLVTRFDAGRRGNAADFPDHRPGLRDADHEHEPESEHGEDRSGEPQDRALRRELRGTQQQPDRCRPDVKTVGRHHLG